MIGLRKDNKFVAEREDGEKKQISEYDLNNYMIVKSENKEQLQKLEDLDNEFKIHREFYIKNKKDTINKLDIVDLKQYKEDNF